MILSEIKAILLNLLFGMFFYITLSTFSLYEEKIKSKIINNLLYFVLTVLCGIIYIFYIDKIFFSFNYYYILFIVLGFYFGYKNKFFKTGKKVSMFNYWLKKLLIIIKKVTLFLINYKLWSKLAKKIKQIIKKKV